MDNNNDRKMIGWAFVSVQALLLITLVVLPGSDSWPTPAGVRAAGAVVVAAGIVLVAFAALRLGPALTPTPVPTAAGSLVSTGLYRYMRHPIYTGVLAVVVGLVIRSGSLVTLAVGVVTVAFFTVKAAWEEARLTERYPDYPTYAATTPRFVPRPGRYR